MRICWCISVRSWRTSSKEEDQYIDLINVRRNTYLKGSLSDENTWIDKAKAVTARIDQQGVHWAKHIPLESVSIDCEEEGWNIATVYWLPLAKQGYHQE